jgi:Rieske Fe-S protein
MSEQVTVPGQGGGSRRTLLVGAAAVGASVVLAACGDDGPDNGGQPGGTTAPGTAAPGRSAQTGGPVVLTTVSDVPVGGGKIFAEKGVVVTQPAAGTFKGFSAICTHQSCPLANVDAGTINCTCHGSRFSIEDGTPKNGPATRPLAPKDVRIDGDKIVLA